MKDIDLLDEYANRNEPGEHEILRQRQKRRLIKQILWIFLKDALYHGVTLILFFLFTKRIIATELYHESGLHRNVLIIYALFATLIHAIITGFELSGDGERRRAFLQLLKTRSFSPLMALEAASPDLTRLCLCHLAFQLPYVLFYHALGFLYPYMTIVEQFYCMDAGWMELVGVGIIGALLHTFVFVLLVTVIRYKIYQRWNKERI